MKIACIGYLHGRGGAERQIMLLADALAERGHQVHLIVLAENKADYTLCDRVKIWDLSSLEDKPGNRIAKRFRGLRQVLAQIRPDISIHYWLQSAYLTALMPKSLCGKILYSERGDPGDKEYAGLLGLVRKLAFRRCDGFVFQSEGARDYFPAAVTKRSAVIHNPVSVPAGVYISSCQKREKKIVTAGRLQAQKNHGLLIDAFAAIAADFPEYTLEIYGDGALEDDLRRQIRENGLSGRINLPGSCKNIFEKLYPASLFVLSSDYEGMPNALMEAMALGLPCISTDCPPGGPRTLIRSGENGILVPVGDKEALAGQMAALLGDPQKAEAMGSAAKKIMETNAPKQIFDQWEAYLRSLI